ncbi:hypothetical protein J5N97_017453 [Dioscorea zingiberensis]|uniref:Uncharacterized protein n=1 Tax=Dioscorea zingiberensis TaxID=325984 RepID=A0A9D5CN86_9LILI|nr:hypothetical protein J5N97_017453 [Dioscorea zingiberensis]
MVSRSSGVPIVDVSTTGQVGVMSEDVHQTDFVSNFVLSPRLIGPTKRLEDVAKNLLAELKAKKKKKIEGSSQKRGKEVTSKSGEVVKGVDDASKKVKDVSKRALKQSEAAPLKETKGSSRKGDDEFAQKGVDEPPSKRIRRIPSNPHWKKWETINEPREVPPWSEVRLGVADVQPEGSSPRVAPLAEGENITLTVGEVSKKLPQTEKRSDEKEFEEGMGAPCASVDLDRRDASQFAIVSGSKQGHDPA